MIEKIMSKIGYVKIERVQEEREKVLKAGRLLHLSYAKIVESMAAEDFGVTPNINDEEELLWFDNNIMKAEYQIENNKLVDGKLALDLS